MLKTDSRHHRRLIEIRRERSLTKAHMYITDHLYGLGKANQHHCSLFNEKTKTTTCVPVFSESNPTPGVHIGVCPTCYGSDPFQEANVSLQPDSGNVTESSSSSTRNCPCSGTPTSGGKTSKKLFLFSHAPKGGGGGGSNSNSVGGGGGGGVFQYSPSNTGDSNSSSSSPLTRPPVDSDSQTGNVSSQPRPFPPESPSLRHGTTHPHSQNNSPNSHCCKDNCGSHPCKDNNSSSSSHHCKENNSPKGSHSCKENNSPSSSRSCKDNKPPSFPCKDVNVRLDRDGKHFSQINNRPCVHGGGVNISPSQSAVNTWEKVCSKGPMANV